VENKEKGIYPSIDPPSVKHAHYSKTFEYLYFFSALDK
jgi:hypothetical protein